MWEISYWFQSLKIKKGGQHHFGGVLFGLNKIFEIACFSQSPWEEEFDTRRNSEHINWKWKIDFKDEKHLIRCGFWTIKYWLEQAQREECRKAACCLIDWLSPPRCVTTTGLASCSRSLQAHSTFLPSAPTRMSAVAIYLHHLLNPSSVGVVTTSCKRLTATAGKEEAQKEKTSAPAAPAAPAARRRGSLIPQHRPASLLGWSSPQHLLHHVRHLSSSLTLIHQLRSASLRPPAVGSVTDMAH